MKKKRKDNLFLILFMVLAIIFIFLNTAFLLVKFFNFSGLATSPSSTGSVVFEIINPPFINITTPLNITYYFDKGDDYTLDLNVTDNFPSENWRYFLYDLKHSNEIVYDNVAFSGPIFNTSFDAVRWDNQLFVYADHRDTGETFFANVTFFIDVPNSAPLLDFINDSLFICEGDFLHYAFNASDPDEDHLTVGISPQDPFFPDYPYEFYGLVNISSAIISGILEKSDARGINEGFREYYEQVYVYDNYNATCCTDTKNVNITVIEKNNPPVIENLTVQTKVWNQGDNSTLYQDIQVTDIEDINLSFGNMSINLTIVNSSLDLVNLFDISPLGVINFTATNLTPIDTYFVTVCVNDTAINNPHANISEVCGQNGLSQTTCEVFNLTITDENRRPTIIDYNPSNLSLNITGGDGLYFNITKYDPDFTIPDAYWYIDNSLIQYNEGNLTDEFEYAFPCGVSGIHKIKAEITDGLLNDSVEWVLNVKELACPKKSSGGGGGGSTIFCFPEWTCTDWGICQSTEKSLDLGILSGEDYRSLNNVCEGLFTNNDLCGFQIRSCVDVNNCSILVEKPQETQVCQYTTDPTCFDGIKNCHHGKCELLIDCGGPCSPCPTCSDNIKNQGEEGVDCGGPCPIACPVKIPFLKKKIVLYIFILLVVILLILAIIKVVMILKARERFSESQKF